LIFRNFWMQSFCTKSRPWTHKNQDYCLNSRGRAAPPEAAPAKACARVTVTLDIDADVLDWLKAQPLDWQREINNLARFYMETSNQPVPPPHEFDRFTYDPEADNGPA
jgi:uncharacterized protein (DUF4415 family)